MEKDKTKSKYKEGIRGEKLYFMKLNEMILGTPEVAESINRIGDQLRATYDTQTFEEFASHVLAHQETLQTASFSSHKHFTDKLAKMVNFPRIAVLSVRDTVITDSGKFS